jgi:hypothetical protein
MAWAMIQNCSSLLRQVSMIGRPAIVYNPKDFVAASNSSPSVEVLVPTEHRPQGFDPAGQNDGRLLILTSSDDVPYFIVPADAVEVSGRVRLMPSTDYLRSNDVLDALGVCMHAALKILICYSCGVALTSEMVPGHRKNHHPSYKASRSIPVVLDPSMNVPAS